MEQWKYAWQNLSYNNFISNLFIVYTFYKIYNYWVVLFVQSFLIILIDNHTRQHYINPLQKLFLKLMEQILTTSILSSIIVNNNCTSKFIITTHFFVYMFRILSQFFFFFFFHTTQFSIFKHFPKVLWIYTSKDSQSPSSTPRLNVSSVIEFPTNTQQCD